MAVTYQKSIDAKNGNSIRFLLINFDYIDGNEYLVKLFVEEYGFIVQEKIDGLWYHIIDNKCRAYGPEPNNRE